MNCPECGAHNLGISETRHPETENVVKRRRKCRRCGVMFVTVERVVRITSRATPTGRIVLEKLDVHAAYERQRRGSR